MYVWIIAAALAAVGGALAAVCIRQRAQLRARASEAQALEETRRALNAARYESSRRRRENAALRRALEEEQRRGDDLAQELARRQDQIVDAQRRAEDAEARRIQAEKSISAGQMKASLLEKKVDALEKEQLAQERLYQDILREKEETLVQLQEAQAKRRSRKKPDVLDQQITINDVLKGM